MVRVYTTCAKKSSAFLCFFIKKFSGFSIPRVVNVFIPVFSRACGIFYENVSHACEIVSAGNFGQKTTIQSNLLDGRRRGFSVFRILPDGARALRSKARRQAARALITKRKRKSEAGLCAFSAQSPAFLTEYTRWKTVK